MPGHAWNQLLKSFGLPDCWMATGSLWKVFHACYEKREDPNNDLKHFSYSMRHELHYDETQCDGPALLKGQPLLNVAEVNFEEGMNFPGKKTGRIIGLSDT